MSQLFSTPFEYDSNFVEATVTNVDPIRFVCSVKTVRGQYLWEVPWLLPSGGAGKNGVHFSPSINDQVIVFTGLTYPVIIGCLPRLGQPSTNLTNVTGEQISADAGNNSNLKNGYVTNPAKPSDFVPGDHVVTTEGGAILAALKNGSVFLRASGLAQIFITKFNDLVRIVGRNFERFSDIGQQTVANVKGRMYEFMGWDRDLNRSKVGLYELKDVIGDVVAGETYLGDPTSEITPPTADNRIRKYWLEDSNNHPLMVEVLEDAGKIIVTVQAVPDTAKTVTQHDTDLFDIKSQNPTLWSQVTVIPGSVHVKSLDTGSGNYTDCTLVPNMVTTKAIAGGSNSQIVQTAAAITLSQSGGATTVIDSSNITHTYGGSKSTVNGSLVKHEHGGHSITVDSSGVHLT